jgi:hypothetical protein
LRKPEVTSKRLNAKVFTYQDWPPEAFNFKIVLEWCPTLV